MTSPAARIAGPGDVGRAAEAVRWSGEGEGAAMGPDDGFSNNQPFFQPDFRHLEGEATSFQIVHVHQQVNGGPCARADKLMETRWRRFPALTRPFRSVLFVIRAVCHQCAATLSAGKLHDTQGSNNGTDDFELFRRRQYSRHQAGWRQRRS
jgi:hypothetical protein